MKVVIPQKMSNSGTIHDLASDQYDREIEMTGYTHAVVAPSYYGLTPTRHRSANGAIRGAKALMQDDYQGVRVIDAKGDLYEVDAFAGSLSPLGVNIAD